MGKEKNFGDKAGINGLGQNSANINRKGRPKGLSKRKQLRKILKDLKGEYQMKGNQLSPTVKKMVYDLYNVTISDYDLKSKQVNYQSSLKHLYFLRSSIGIKIGMSKNVLKRLHQIRTYAPDVEVLKIIHYGAEYEKKVHQKFKVLNIKGNHIIGTEWFTPNDDLMCWIDQIDNIGCLIALFGKSSTIKLWHQLSLFD